MFIFVTRTWDFLQILRGKTGKDEKMKIRNAELCDLPYLLDMLENAKASLRALGIDQWQNGYPNENTLREDIQNKICRVVIDDENNILASAAVYVGDEPTYHEIYNGAWQTENKIYGIVHRIMAANHAKKRGAASFLMTYCAKLSLEAGVTSMRCDTHPGNIIMQHTLEKNGYIRCGIIHLTDGADRFAYEKVLK